MPFGETVELHDLYLIHETDAAYLVCNEDRDEAWIAKSQVSNIEFGNNCDVDSRPAKRIRILEIPAWLQEKIELWE